MADREYWNGNINDGIAYIRHILSSALGYDRGSRGGLYNYSFNKICTDSNAIKFKTNPDICLGKSCSQMNMTNLRQDERSQQMFAIDSPEVYTCDKDVLYIPTYNYYQLNRTKDYFFVLNAPLTEDTKPNAIPLDKFRILNGTDFNFEFGHMVSMLADEKVLRGNAGTRVEVVYEHELCAMPYFRLNSGVNNTYLSTKNANGIRVLAPFGFSKTEPFTISLLNAYVSGRTPNSNIKLVFSCTSATYNQFVTNAKVDLTLALAQAVIFNYDELIDYMNSLRIPFTGDYDFAVNKPIDELPDFNPDAPPEPPTPSGDTDEPEGDSRNDPTTWSGDNVAYEDIPASFPTYSGTGRYYEVDSTQMLRLIEQLVSRTNLQVLPWTNKNFEGIQWIKAFPFAIDVNTTAEQIILGNWQAEYPNPSEVGYLPIKGNKVTSYAVIVDCGTIGIPRKYNTFLDYSPYTSGKLFLPFVGFVDVNINELIGKYVHIYYVGTIVSGEFKCVVNVATKSDGTDAKTLYMFNCHIGTELPIQYVDNTQIGNAVANVGASLFTGVLTAGVTGSAGVGLVSGILPTATEIATMKPSLSRSNGVSNETFLEYRKPYLLLTRPVTSIPDNYSRYFGRPCNKSLQLSSLVGKGYTEVGEIHLDGISCTNDERATLESLLKEGVIL